MLISSSRGGEVKQMKQQEMLARDVQEGRRQWLPRKPGLTLDWSGIRTLEARRKQHLPAETLHWTKAFLCDGFRGPRHHR